MGLEKVTTAAAVMGLLLVLAAAVLRCPTAVGAVDDEVKALVAIRAVLHDPGKVLRDWDAKAGGDPCHWRMITCFEGQVYELFLVHQNLTGTLSPAIGRLKYLRYLSLYHNAISGPIPDTIGTMQFLESLDLSNNQFTGSIPSSLGGLVNLQCLKLNNNSLSGLIPESLATARMISTLDLSFNNLSGPWPIFHARIVSLDGNPLLTGINCGKSQPGVGNNPLYGGNCSSAVTEQQLDLPVPKSTNTADDSLIMDESTRILCILALCIAIVCLVTTFATGIVMLFWRGRRRQQVFAVDDMSSAISITDSGLSQFSISTMLILP